MTMTPVWHIQRLLTIRFFRYSRQFPDRLLIVPTPRLEHDILKIFRDILEDIIKVNKLIYKNYT